MVVFFLVKFYCFPLQHKAFDLILRFFPNMLLQNTKTSRGNMKYVVISKVAKSQQKQDIFVDADITFKSLKDDFGTT